MISTAPKPKLRPRIGDEVTSVRLTALELGNALTAAQSKEEEIKHHWLTAFSGGNGYRWCFTQSEVCGSGQRHGYLIWGELVRQCPVQFRTTE